MSGPRLASLGVVALALVLLLLQLGEITGMHGDEAWVLARVHDIAEGSRPTNGMNAYTGILHLYPLWPLCEIFGYRVEVLRAFFAIFAAGSLLALMQCARLLGLETRGAVATACFSPRRRPLSCCRGLRRR